MVNVNDSHALEIVAFSADLSNEVAEILKWAIYSGVCQAFNVFGVVTNIINIICFTKQGFNDPVNISLLGLSISDLGCLATLLVSNFILLAPVMDPEGLPFDPFDVTYLGLFIPHLAFSRVSSWITAIITLERCLCIVAPLEVKSMITRKRMMAIIVGVFSVLFLCGSPSYAVNKLGAKVLPGRNKTVVGLLRLGNWETVETIIFAANNFFIPVSSFVVIVFCTIILVCKLHTISKWRNSASTAKNNVTIRNQRVAKMVVMISVLFISCFIPLSIFMVALAFEPALSITGKYINIATVIIGLGFVLESVNSSVNIFIYYTMSSKFRLTYRALFCRGNWGSLLGDAD